METPAIALNLKRVERLVDDHVQLRTDGMPLFNWVEVSPIEMCNRTCVFCPKSNPMAVPNQPLMISPQLYKKMADELEALHYRGTVILAGYGEPMMFRGIYDLVSAFSRVARTEIATNGDSLSVASVEKLLRAGISMVLVSLYDGPAQIERFERIFAAAGAPSGSYLLRDRWYGAEQDFGVKLTNRAGTVQIGNQPAAADHLCYYPHYSMMVDWNGDVFLCTQDWNRRVKSGNLMVHSMLEVWSSAVLRKYRGRLAAGRRDLAPCSQCNADGTLHGWNHAEAWERYYARGAAR